MNGCLRKFGTAFLLSPVLLLTTFPAGAQYYGQQDNRDRQNNGYSQSRSNQGYYSGMRDGGRGGNYDRNEREQYPQQGYNGYYSQNNRAGYRNGDRVYRQDNGIGPGKGAAIGAAGGAVLGALFGGGMKGVVIGGAAGAGVGAVAGKAAQDNRRNRENY